MTHRGTRSVTLKIHALALLVAAAACLATAAAAHAQEAGFLPRPIGGAEIEQYAQRLNLSDDQRLAMERAYEEYLDEFRRLRESEIAAYADGFEGRFMAGMMGDVSQVEAEARMTTQLIARIASLDDAFFDDLLETLSDAQAPMLDRVRLMRERVRYKTHPMMEMMRSIDLVATVEAVAMSEKDRAAADAVLGQYEERLTRLHRRMHRASLDSMVHAAREMAAIEIDPEVEAEEEALAAFFEAQEQAEVAMLRSVADLHAELMDLNLATYRMIADSIAYPAARELRRRFHKGAYREVAMLTGNAEPLLDAALALHDLPETKRRAIDGLRSRFVASADRTIEEASARIHRFRKEMFDHHLATEEHMKTHWDWLREEREALMKHEEAVIATLRDILGERFAEVRPATTEPLDHQTIARLNRPDAWAVFDSDASSFARKPHHLVPRSINRSDIEVYSRIFELDVDSKSFLDEMYDAYRDDWDERVTPALDEHRRLNRRAMSHDEDVEESDLAAANRALRALVQTIESADEAFFDDLRDALIEPVDDARLELLMLMRRRDVLHPYTTRYETAWRNTSRLDLARVLATLPAQAVSALDWRSLAPRLVEYQRSVMPHIHARYESHVEIGEAMRRFSLESRRLHAANAPMVERLSVDLRRGQAVEAIERRVNAADRAIAAANREMLAILLDELPPNLAAALEDRYTLIAFPNVHSRELPVARLLREAAALPDLSEAQRTSLSELTAQYHHDYALCIERMLEISRAADEDAATPGSRAGANHMEHMTQEATRRAELQQATVRRLRVLLRPEQTGRIAAWPDTERVWTDVIP